MGMFDSMYDQAGREFQTKAFGCSLHQFQLGEEMPAQLSDYQVEIFGGGELGTHEGDHESFATVLKGKLYAVDVPRDRSIPLLEYSGTRKNDS